MKKPTDVRPRRLALLTAFGLSVFATGMPPALADWPADQGIFSEMSTCLRAVAGADAVGEGASAGSRCALARAWNAMFDKAAHFANEQGQARLGENFHIVTRLNYSPSSGGVDGDLDVIVPLSFASVSEAADGGVGAGKPRALFMQHGVTTWEDDYAFRRNDMRFGMVHRFALSEIPGRSVVGVSVVFQQNVERGHERIVPGLDYAGKWGTGSVSFFLPTTDWRPGRAGYEERAREGMEVGFRMDPTTTISLKMAFGRWEDRDDSGRWEARGRMAIGWRPHPWLTLAAASSLGHAHEDSKSFRLTFSRPFGGGYERPPRWLGVGRLAGGAAPGADALWRPLDSVGRIEFVEREAADEQPDTVDGASVRFLQDSTQSGGEFTLEVVLPSAGVGRHQRNRDLGPGKWRQPCRPGRGLHG